ncbi:unnamed protein product [Trichogramma brassicae]|uniref:Dynein regulatory complex protein 9 n=1 Tax=Trichogramma brassicae TaxID=86971 RepID=A0A6H5IW75_9HYME|nr:unnamed protein product [Trichogramma brassicae]
MASTEVKNDEPVKDETEKSKKSVNLKEIRLTAITIDSDADFEDASSRSLVSAGSSNISPSRNSTVSDDPAIGPQYGSRPSINPGVYRLSMHLEAKSKAERRVEELESTMFSLVLREAIDELDILKRTIRREAPKLEERNFCRENPEDKQPKMLHFVEETGHELVVLPVAEKLLRDVGWAQNILSITAEELESNGSYYTLLHHVNEIASEHEKRHKSQMNSEVLEDTAKNLEDSIENFRATSRQKIQQYHDELENLEKSIDESFCANNEKIDYTERTEQTRYEQKQHELWLKEQSVLREIGLLDKSKRSEDRTSRELQAYTKLAIAECEAQTVDWTSRYNSELEQRSQRMNEMKEKIEKIEEELEKLEELRAERQVLVDEYEAEQQRILDEIEYWKAVHRAATIVQSQWRGYMVRHELGEFANLKVLLLKAKKKKKKGKKKKK